MRKTSISPFHRIRHQTFELETLVIDCAVEQDIDHLSIEIFEDETIGMIFKFDKLAYS